MAAKLSAFQGDPTLKQVCLDQIDKWLEKKLKPKSPHQIASSIFNTTRVFKPSSFALENYERYPENLGLPQWIANVMLTFNHHLSSDGFKENYEVWAYPKFVEACKPGTDYTLLFHKWEVLLMEEFLPSDELARPYLQKVIELHKATLNGKQQPTLEWISVMNTLQKESQAIDEFYGVPKEVGLAELAALEHLTEKQQKNEPRMDAHEQYNDIHRYRMSFSEISRCSIRSGFLSAYELIGPPDANITSVEAIADVIKQLAVNRSEGKVVSNNRDITNPIYTQLLMRFIEEIKNWNNES